MADDPKTIAIDSSELLARQREAASGSAPVQETIPINSAELARRQQTGRPKQAAAPARAGNGRTWALIAAAVVGAVVAFALAG